MFSMDERVRYLKPQLMEVICQLRFPTILSIGAKDPVDFQEKIRAKFPRYIRKTENPVQIVNGKPEPQPPVINHEFLSADGRWSTFTVSAQLLAGQGLREATVTLRLLRENGLWKITFSQLTDWLEVVR